MREKRKTALHEASEPLIEFFSHNMPTFGDYETIGEPIVSREEHGHVSTIWQARKIGANDGRLYVVKHYVPRRGDAKEAGDALDIDRGLEFLGGVKHLKQAY